MSVEEFNGNGNIFCGYNVPDEIILNIFTNLPDKCLLQVVPLVCKHWHLMSYSWHLWKVRFNKLGIKISKLRQQKLLSTWKDPKVRATLQWLCIHERRKAFNHNLLKNPSGEEQFKYWNTKNSQISIEEPPVGSDPIPSHANLPTQHCFVSSYTLAYRSQTVVLGRDFKLKPFVLDVLQPTLRISEWVSARFDCGSKSIIKVKVFGKSEEKTIIKEWKDSDYDRVAWFLVQENLKYNELPKGIVSIKFENQSKDTQFWAGNYGAKTAGSSVLFDIATD